MQISPGVRVGAFEIRALVGAGGMGTVYRAHDTRLGRDVAIKILQEQHSARTDYLRRFEREARSASALNHPNIVTIFEINEFDGAPFIAMELIEGTRIRDLLRDGPIPLRKLLTIATQIADGLAAAHDRAIVHRDIKPENVMITKLGLVKILDFGLARPVINQAGQESSSGGSDADSDAITSETITREIDQRLLGTAGYMSPEQATAGPVDYRSDQFSFGALLYEMATGRRAFAGGSIAATIQAIIREDPVPMRQLNPKLPSPLCWIVERCLAKDPADRYASTTDLARELHTLRDRLPDTGPNIKALPFSAMSRKRALMAGSIAAVVMFFATAVAIWNRGSYSGPAAVGQASLAVLPFQDLSGRPDGSLFSRGLAEAVSAQLQKFSSIQVIPPTSSTPLIAQGATERRIAEELGVTWVLSGSVQRNGDALKVRYTLTDSIRNVPVATETVSGSAGNVWALLDELSGAVARRLGATQTVAPTDQSELESGEEQELYIRALGQLLNQHEDPKALDAALALLRELLETASDSPLVHAALARTYLEKYNLSKDRAWSEKASQAADRARALAPDSPEVLLAQASVQQFTGRFTDAIATFKRALVLQPNSPEAVLGLAKSYYGAGQLDDAERSFLRSVRMRPSWWSSHHELGVLYLNRGRYDEAAGEFKKVIELNPAASWGYVNLGVVYVTRERLDDAVAAFTKAVSIREDPSAYANLGYCHYYLGQYDKSGEAYRKAAALSPKRATYWASLADACRWSSQCKGEVESATATAIELLRQELAVNPGSGRANATLAVCLAHSGRHKEAQERMQMALRLEPENPARMFQAGRVANLTGNPIDAVEWFRRANAAGYGRFELPRDPELATIRNNPAYKAAFGKPPATG